MIQVSEFPYLSALQINDCFACKDININLEPHQPFSHLVITGKNGSGKSTVLRNLDFFMNECFKGKDPIQYTNQLKQTIQHSITTHANLGHILTWEKQVKEIDRLIPKFQAEYYPFLYSNLNSYIYTFLGATRNVELRGVESVTKEDVFLKELDPKNSSKNFTALFKQYLVNKKVYQAFDTLDKKTNSLSESERFFDTLEKAMQAIFEDTHIKLLFERENFEFYLELGDNRKITFNQLSDGFSAFLSVLMDLFMRVDLIRKQVQDFSYNPCGIVLIDEPETHLHLQLQYQVLPILTGFFPNIQFVVATHSPAIISSIKNVTVFDLSSKQNESDEVAGKSFSELMISHFGLDNEYSPIADEIIKKINETMLKYADDKEQLQRIIKEILQQNDRFLSASLRLELESILILNA